MRTQWLVQALLAAALAACQATGPPQPVKSPIDDREYRHVVLPNHLHALLIHAPGSDRAAAAASVARGSDHDPDAHEGLAHFVEHMLFIATEKYPEVDGFTDFVLKRGGGYSACTASDRTTYHFHLRADRLPEALDRFAQFFVAPRFDPDYVEREKESVQSEYQLQSKQDEWRGFAVDKRLFNPAHPTSRFNIGSLETLRGAGVPEVARSSRPTTPPTPSRSPFSDLKTSTTWKRSSPNDSAPSSTAGSGRGPPIHRFTAPGHSRPATRGGPSRKREASGSPFRSRRSSRTTAPSRRITSRGLSATRVRGACMTC